MAASAQVVQHRVPVDRDGRVSVTALAGIALDELGTVGLPDGAASPRWRVTGRWGRLGLATANVALARAGVALAVEGRSLVVRVDRRMLGRAIDRAETALRRLLGRPARFTARRAPASRPGGPPVALIHGIDSTSRALAAAAAALGRRGYAAYLIDYPNDSRILRSATEVGRLLRLIHRRTGRPVTVVAHSMGALVVQAYLELDPARGAEVGRFVAISPPFHGARMARYHLALEVWERATDVTRDGWRGLLTVDGLGQAARDLLPGSPLLRRLATARRAPGIRYSILAGSGPILSPEAHRVLAGRVAALRRSSRGTARGWVDRLDRLVALSASLSGGAGDGVVRLDSQTLGGVSDRVVRPINHIQPLRDRGPGRPMPWLADVLARLPPT